MFKKITPLSLALLASAALNGILIGMLLSGAPSNDRRDRGPQGSPIIINNDILSRTLPQGRRDDFQRGLDKDSVNEIRKALREVTALQTELGEHIQQSPENVDQMATLLEAIRQKRLHVSEMGDQALVEYIRSLTPVERKTVLANIAIARRRGGGGGGDGVRLGNRDDDSDGMNGGRGGPDRRERSGQTPE